jgi:hypothetical protein
MNLRSALFLFLLTVMTSCSIFNPVELHPEAPAASTTPDGNPILRRKILLLQPLNRTGYADAELARQVMTEIRSATLRLPDVALVEEEEIEGHEDFATDDSAYNYRGIFAKARAYGVSGVLASSLEDLSIDVTGGTTGLWRTQTFTASATVKIELFDAVTERNLMTREAVEQASDEKSRFFWDHTENRAEELARGKLAVGRAAAKALASLSDSARRIAWYGRIAKVDLHRYYVNAGEASGISIGQLLKVFDESKAITDPQTGRLIGMAPGHFKGILKVIDHFGTDGAVAVVHSGGGFRELDRVEVYSPPQDR